ncbi:TadE family protein [Burkholderia sp. Ax-1719]|uniref:TadE/TadG family type IV pilus assembly protein n=1 Tax=Burkholderia sp. Ax-1719 TaxID=2608334 RepID=UPI001423C90E|nr:TadE family protein [Burkholderia sp. Ax-1719]NIE65149.1 pilus assembly protein [Burkholderia sp. Ax-1719]
MKARAFKWRARNDHASRRSGLRGQRRSRRHQRGVAAVEFALAFPLFFTILYAIVMYSMMFLVQHSLTSAAAEGARAALVYQYASSTSAALTSRGSAACTRALAVVSWLTQAPTCTPVVSAAPSGCSSNTAMDCVQVTLTYPWGSSPLIPPLPLMGLISPTSLVGQATVQIDPVNIL